jgi:exonuclease SbcC
MLPLFLSLENFCCFEKSYLYFDFSSALLIGVRNDNELRANAVGKSTIFLAIEYALFNETQVNMEKIIRDNTTKASVVFDFEFEGEIYRIVRHRTKSKSDVNLFRAISYNSDSDHNDEKLWKNLSSRRNSDTEKDIAKIIKMNCNTFRDTVHFIQNDISSGLASATPEERKKLLKTALNIGFYQKLEKFVKEEFSALEKDLLIKKTSYAGFGNPDEAITIFKSEIENLTSQTQEINIIIANQNLTLQPIDAKKLGLEKNLAVIDSSYKNLSTQKNALAVDISNTQNQITKSKQQIQEIVGAGKNIKIEIDKITTTIKSNKQNIKDVTDFEKELPALKEKEIQYLSNIRVAESKIKELDAFLSQQQPISLAQLLLEVKDTQGLNEELSSFTEKYLQYRAEISVAQNKIKELKYPLPEQDVCQNCKQTITDEHRSSHARMTSKLIQNNESNIINLELSIGNIINRQKEIKTVIEYQKQLHDKIELGKKIETAQIQLSRHMQSKDADSKNLILIQKEYQQKHAEVSEQNKLVQLILSLEKEIEYKEKEIIQKRSNYTQLSESVKENEKLLIQKQNDFEVVNENLSKFDLSESDRLNKEIDMLSQEILDIKSKINISQTQLNDLLSKINFNKHQIEAKQQEKNKIAVLVKEIGELEETMASYPEVIQAFSSTGIPNLIIQGVLDTIQTNTNHLLSQFKTDIQIQFKTEKEVKDEVTDTLEIIYLINGREREFAQLSGAQKIATHFSLKLGLGKLLQNLLGIQVNFIQIDEIDASLDDFSVDQLHEIITELSKEYKIITITHNPRMKSKFHNNKIVVEQNIDGVSRIIQN